MVANERSIFRNTGFSVAGRGLGELCNFLFLVVFARQFGSQTLGEFSLAMAIGGIAAGFLFPGFGTLLVREVSRRRDQGPQLVGAVTGAQGVLAVLLFALVAGLGGALVDGQRAWHILAIMCAYQMLYTVGMPHRHYFRACEQTQYSALLEASHKAIVLVVGLALIMTLDDAAHVLLVYPLAALCMFVGGYALVGHHQGPPRLHVDLALTRNWFFASLPLLASSILTLVEVRAGIIYLGVVGDSDSVGQFAAGERLIAAAGIGFLLFNSAIYPVMSRLDEAGELNRLLARCQRLAAMVALPLAVALYLLREPIIGLLFGPEFHAGSQVLGILAFGLAATALVGPANALLLARQRLKAMLMIQVASLAAFFAALAMLVPAAGFVGLAWAMLLQKGIAAVATLTYLHRCGHPAPYLSILRGPVAAAIGMWAAFVLSGTLPLALRCLLMLGAGAALLIATGGLRASDLAYLRRILGSKA